MQFPAGAGYQERSSSARIPTRGGTTGAVQKLTTVNPAPKVFGVLIFHSK
jgi:hypothetical protein